MFFLFFLLSEATGTMFGNNSNVVLCLKRGQALYLKEANRFKPCILVLHISLNKLRPKNLQISHRNAV